MNSNMSFQILCLLGHICLFLIEDVSNYNSCCSVTQSCLTLCNPMDWAHQASLSFANLPELAQTHVHWVGDAIQSSHPQPSPSPLLSLFPSIRVFSNQSALHIRWPKYWSFSFSISPSSEYLGLISFKMDWLDLLAVQGTLKHLLQNHSSKASILQHRFIYFSCVSIRFSSYILMLCFRCIHIKDCYILLENWPFIVLQCPSLW